MAPVKLSIALYLAMGWLAVFAVKPLYIQCLPGDCFGSSLVVSCIQQGSVFFAYDHKSKYNHFIWHLFVLAGTSCHVIAVIVYAFHKG